MQQWINQHWSIPLLLATFGPAAALVFGLPSLPASQPLNCFGGTFVCGIVGLFFRVLVGRQAWLAMGLATACAISLMELMSLAYPPGLNCPLVVKCWSFVIQLLCQAVLILQDWLPQSC
ncbi:TPA: hypothetical protein ACH3X2_008774 [Trebouxia sp. C0005]